MLRISLIPALLLIGCQTPQNTPQSQTLPAGTVMTTEDGTIIQTTSAQPGMVVQGKTQNSSGHVVPALGMGWMKVPIPVPKLFAVPTGQPQPQHRTVVMPPQMMSQYPGMMSHQPGMMPYQPVASGPVQQPGMDAAQMAALIKLMQQQQAGAPQSTAANAEQQALEARAEKLEAQIDKLTEALEQ